MNMKNLGLPLVALTFLVLAGCSTQTVVTLQNGTQYLTKDTPNAKTADGFYEFKSDLLATPHQMWELACLR